MKGVAETGSVRSAKATIPLELRTTAAVALPLEATFHFRAVTGDALTFQAVAPDADPKTTKPLLQCTVRMMNATQASIAASADGEPMATTAITMRNGVRKNGGSVNYAWRFPKVKNLWDEADRKEIGAAYAKLTPFEEKTFVLRFVMNASGRQIWLDDRLVAETRVASPKEAALVMQVSKSAQILAAEFTQPREPDRFLPLPLTHYSHAKTAVPAKADLTKLNDVPVLVPTMQGTDVNLADSLYRYRRTNGGGPNAS